MVLQGRFDGIRVLWIPPLNVRGQSQLLEAGADLRSEVVIAALPAQGEPLRDELLRRIQPEIVILTETSALTRRRTVEASRRRLASQVRDVRVMSETGYMEIRIRKGGWKVISTRQPIPAAEAPDSPQGEPLPTEEPKESGGFDGTDP